MSTRKEVANFVRSISDYDLSELDIESDDLPEYDSVKALDIAALRLQAIIKRLKDNKVNQAVMVKNLNYASSVLDQAIEHEMKRLSRQKPGLPLIKDFTMCQQVQQWLKATFTEPYNQHALRTTDLKSKNYYLKSSECQSTNVIIADVINILNAVDDWSFDIFGLYKGSQKQPMKIIGNYVLKQYGIVKKFKIPQHTLDIFLARVEEGYNLHNNPYHNCIHGADVTQTMHYMLSQTNIMGWLSELELFASVVAALIHDYEHTGINNNMHIKTQSKLAMLYNDKSILENHHVSSTFTFLTNSEHYNILKNLTSAEYKEFRRLVIDLVLSSDMQLHMKHCKEIEDILALPQFIIGKSRALSFLLHCCDISYPAKSWEVQSRWASSVFEEYWQQGDKEKELGLPVSPLHDRNIVLIESSQIGFLTEIVKPCFELCSEMLDKISALTTKGQPAIIESLAGLAMSVTSNIGRTDRPWEQHIQENIQKWTRQRDGKGSMQITSSIVEVLNI